MRKVKIITDSCSDLSPELLKEYDIDYAKMSTMLDDKSTPALLEWTAEQAHAFYNLIRDGKKIITSQVAPQEFERIFTEYLEKDYDIVYIGCSLKQSNSVNTGATVAESLKSKYPDARIFCIDSQNASYGIGMLAIEAAKLAKQGKDAQEINDSIINIRKTINQFVTVHTLEYLRRAGRVTGSSAFFGNLMGVKPILIADAVGAQAAFKKVRGRVNSMLEIVKLLKDGVINSEDQTIYLAHSDCDEKEVSLMKEMIEKEIPCKNIHIGTIGPIIGASIGPDAFAVFGFGKQITFCGEEK